MAEVDIGIGKTARRAYRLDDVAIVPSKRTRDPADVDIDRAAAARLGKDLEPYRLTCGGAWSTAPPSGSRSS